jgi:small basic protein (TIGR04137 family)
MLASRLKPIILGVAASRQSAAILNLVTGGLPTRRYGRKSGPPYVGCYGGRRCCWFIEPQQINRLQSAGNRLFCLLGFAGNSTERKFMSQHRSLRAASTLGGKRNVLKRFERTALLEKRGQRKAGDRITGLRKTKPEV